MSSYYYPPGDMTNSGMYDDIGDIAGLYCGTCEDNGVHGGVIEEETEAIRRGNMLSYTCPVCGTEQVTACV